MARGTQNRLLTDRGVREAEISGMLRLDPKPDGKQRQPASIDLEFGEIVDREPLPIAGDGHEDRWRGDTSTLLPKHENDVKTTTSIWSDSVLRPFAEMRSSMRRLGCYNRIPAFNAAYGLGSIPGGYTVTLEVVNYGSMGIRLKKGDRIGQLMVFFDSPSREDLDDPHVHLLPNISKAEYRRHLEIDSGYEVKSGREIRALASKGYFSVEPEMTLRKNLIEVHAGRYAMVLRADGAIDFSSRPDGRELFEEVELPYRIKPGEFIDVDTVESLDLSKHVGIIFYSEDLFERFYATKEKIERGRTDRELAIKWDGWVDPGYSGPFSRQPKTFYPMGKLVKQGDVLGYGSVFFFPEGVERPYGSSGLGSHYQNGGNGHFVK